MNNIDRQYKELSYHILNFGIDKADRTGTGTKSIFGWQIRHNMKDGFPLLTTNVYEDIYEILASFGMNIIVAIGFWLEWKKHKHDSGLSYLLLRPQYVEALQVLV